MNNYDVKRNEIKNKTREIIQSDKRDLFLDKFNQNYSKDKNKETISKEEFFKQKEK